MPYEFEFEEKNANYTLTRQESGDDKGVVRGQYSFIDKDGNTRTVVYQDVGNGFEATVHLPYHSPLFLYTLTLHFPILKIQSNEPGLVSHQAADATYNVQ